MCKIAEALASSTHRNKGNPVFSVALPGPTEKRVPINHPPDRLRWPGHVLVARTKASDMPGWLTPPLAVRKHRREEDAAAGEPGRWVG